MKLLLTFIMGFLSLISSSYAQDDSNITALFAQNEYSTDSDNDLLFICRAPIDKQVKKKDWESGILIDYNDKAYLVEGHYDVSSDEIQILLQNEPRTVFPQKIKAMKVGEMILVPCEFEGQEALVYGYFQVLSTNKIDLLKRFETQQGEIVKSFYTRKEEEAAKALKLSKNNILKKLDSKRTSEYLRSKNLNVKKEKDLVAIFDYYNEEK